MSHPLLTLKKAAAAAAVAQTLAPAEPNQKRVETMNLTGLSHGKKWNYCGRFMIIIDRIRCNLLFFNGFINSEQLALLSVC